MKGIKYRVYFPSLSFHFNFLSFFLPDDFTALLASFIVSLFFLMCLYLFPPSSFLFLLPPLYIFSCSFHCIHFLPYSFIISFLYFRHLLFLSPSLHPSFLPSLTLYHNITTSHFFFFSVTPGMYNKFSVAYMNRGSPVCVVVL